MNPLQRLGYGFSQFLVDRGWKSPQAAFVQSLPDKDLQPEVMEVMESQKSLPAVMDPIGSMQTLDYTDQKIHRSLERLDPDERRKAVGLLGPVTGVGYEPAGSVLRKLYPNPLSTVGFVCDNYWVCQKARREVRVEVIMDSYNFNTLAATSKKRIRLAWEVLMDLGLLQNVDEIVDQLNCYANCWLRPEYNAFGGLTSYTILQPDRIRPYWNTSKHYIQGWYYDDNGYQKLYGKDELVHLKTYSARTQEMGAPPISSLIVDLEAAMFASVYNNTLFQKGGMVGHLIALKSDPKAAINERGQSLVAEIMQAKWDKRFAGVRGTGQTILSPMIENLFRMSVPGEMDGTHQHLIDNVDRKAALLLGVSPERIGVPITSQYQDKGLTSDRVIEAFDNNVSYLSGIAYAFFTQVLHQQMDMTDIIITSGGAYKTMAVAAAQYAKLLAESGGVITVDEFRTMVLKLPAFGGELGGRLLDVSVNRKADSVPAEQGPGIPDTRYMQRLKGMTCHTWQDIQTYSKW